MSTAVKWWRRPWVVPLMVVTVVFLAFSLPPYLTLDATRARLPIRADAPGQYPLLVLHILFGSVALLTSCLQVWPWFRGRYRVAHRRIGRVYVFAGVLPSAVLAIPTSVYGHSGPVGAAGNVVLAVLWQATTTVGFRMARERRFAEHRRWMIRSFALGTSIVANRVWLVVLLIALLPSGASEAEFATATRHATVAAVWLSWVANLVIAEWWIARSRRKERQPVGVS
ncbi:DUF2306 domain-containing protein [Umezawaea sp. Da 62-37]|uniref:DUF2306 domain-containing protein n=1 Tax=Umezawaea sp. Da 62-37 TaxID=3075927 RepID=UPI0028F70348|nr:DUF2306 domain-containing protein [Umezawaea sp. Da 62-37]WNV83408.1 DUF2306 domain-containing protein [Umezawaea sp. Da 62-37]